MVMDPAGQKYWLPVDATSSNNSHAFALQLIGSGKRVLELGCGPGHVTEQLVHQGCTVVGVERDEAAAASARTWAESVLVLDLSSPRALSAALSQDSFDVVCAGDVLEHLPDPAEALSAACARLRPDGYVVASLPNVAHADVKLRLLRGEFPYQDLGLLDATHLRFFTLSSALELMASCGLEVVDVLRVTLPAFATELAVDPVEVSVELLAEVTRAPESETYQFVIRARPIAGSTAAARPVEDPTSGWRAEAVTMASTSPTADEWIASVQAAVHALDSDRYFRSVLDEFHRLYYEAGELGWTWRDTSWLGVPVRKSPFDLWMYQEIISELQPDLIIESGTAMGGSAAFLASMCDLVGRGRVVTIDISADPDRPRHDRIDYVSGSSTDPAVVEDVRARAARADRVLVILDSDHSAAHVTEELRLYSPLVTVGSYLVVEDTNINGHPVLPEFGPGPMEAVDRFLAETSEFTPDPRRERLLMTFSPNGWLLRVHAASGT